jgi:ATP-dependent Lon protease
MIEKLRNCFDEMVVYKDLKKSNLFSSLSLPSFMRDWLLKRFEDESGHFESDDLIQFVRTYLPRKDDWTAIKNRVIIENERVKLLAKISSDIAIKTGEVSFSLPDFGLSSKDTIIEDMVWDNCKDDLVHGRETWGMVEIGYRPPDDDIKQAGKIKLTSFKSFCPYTIDLEYYKDARREFSTQEWLNVLLGAVDYNASGYVDDDKVDAEEKKLTMLTRLLPFVEKRLNLIELAPKGTGKSYLFGRVSRFGWLSSGGVMSRAKMFYDISKRTEGLVAGNDFVTLDEVQTISFTDVDEMRAALKGYLESGIFTVGNYEGTADAGVILCGNIKKEIRFALFNFKFILNLYADPEKADVDASKSISPTEAVSVAIALSLDGIAAGMGAAFGGVNGWALLISAFVINALAIFAGCRIGRKVSQKSRCNLSWLGGLILMAMAVLKLF